MTHIEKLDKMLEYIAVNDERRNRHSICIYKRFESVIPENEIPLIIEKLEKDGFIKKIITENPNNCKVEPPYNCLLTYDGFLFFEKKGYKCKKRIDTIRQIWIVAKTIAVILNAVIIVSIGFWSIKVQSDSKEKDETIKNIDTKIEILSAKVDRLTTAKETKKKQIENQAPNR